MTNEQWNPKQRYAFLKIISGLKRAGITKKRARHLVLTTSNDPAVKSNPKQLYIDAKELTKRVRRMTPLKFILTGFILPTEAHKYFPNKPINEPLYYQYHRVRTNEVNGVLHIVAVSDFIPYHWITQQWEEIHKSPIVSITEISPDNYGDRANYIVTQYVSDQKSSYVRSSMTKNFIFPGWSKQYTALKNSIYRYRYKGQQRDDYGNWHIIYYSEAEWNEKQFYRDKNQTRLFPVVLSTDTKLIRERWDACINENSCLTSFSQS
jgi:hypothetical protein